MALGNSSEGGGRLGPYEGTIEEMEGRLISPREEYGELRDEGPPGPGGRLLEAGPAAGLFSIELMGTRRSARLLIMWVSNTPFRRFTIPQMIIRFLVLRPHPPLFPPGSPGHFRVQLGLL